MLDHKRDQEIEIEKVAPGNSGDENEVRLQPEEMEAISQACRESDDEYRRLYQRNIKNKYETKKAGKLTKALAFLYLIALAVFAANITTMEVLPLKHLSAVILCVAAISVVVVAELCRSNVRTWIRVLMSLLCIALIAVYCVGSLYIIRTKDFLDITTEESQKKVESLTYEPFNVMITGIDVSGTIDEKGRSDVNMLVTVNPNTSQILMTSIPRDYMIYMPDKNYEMDKLTHTGNYGVDTTIQAEEDLLRTEINYYVKVNFTTVEKFIDAIGGVDVYSEYTFSAQYSPWTFYEGMNHLNGEQALAFARERKAFEAGDNQRIKNQQAVVEAVIKKATSSKEMLLKYSDIVSSLKDYIKMSISSAEIKELIRMQISENPDWKIYKYSLRGEGDMLQTYSSQEYLYVMTHDQKSVSKARELISGVLEGKELTKADNGALSFAEPEPEEGEN